MQETESQIQKQSHISTENQMSQTPLNQKVISLFKITNPFQETHPFLYIQTRIPKSLLAFKRLCPAYTGGVTSFWKLKCHRVS